MNIMFDIVHPAHVHFFKHMIRGLEERGHKTLIVARDKDVTHQLLDLYGFEYATVGHSRPRNRIGQFRELVERDRFLCKLGRKFKPDVILTRNPAGVQAARLLGATGIFDTDDGLAAGIHFRAAAPFAHIITTPDCLTDSYGRKHVKYPGYKQSAYLHPDHFHPDPKVLELLKVQPGERYFLVRFVSMHASHDKGEAGLPLETKHAIVDRLLQEGRVFISSEQDMPPEWNRLRVKIPPHLIHDAIAFCDLFIGDSQTMAAEAAVLGTPNLRASSFVGRISYLEELEYKYNLTFAFHPNQSDRLLNKLDELLTTPDARTEMKLSHEKMLSDKENIAQWFIDYIDKGLFKALS